MKTMQITREQLKPGMTLAIDIMSPDGIKLIPSGTVLTEKHIRLINSHTHEKIIIQLDEASPKLATDNRSTEPLDDAYVQSLDDASAFEKFSYKYDQQVDQIKEHLSQIVETGTIDRNALYEVASELLSTTAKQSKLFSYMCRISSTDDVTYNHSLNVSLLASIFGQWLDMPNEDIQKLAIAGLLHDIGKIKVKPEVLNKKGRLTDAEFTHIKQHTTFGYEIVQSSDLDTGIKQAVLMHHEKMNGGGYPLGLSWDRIHEYAKIIAIVDIYDAMTADRPYHNKRHPFEVLRMFEEETYGILDTKYLYVFLENIAHNFIGEKVKLSNGSEGEIMFIHKQTPSKPLVKTTEGRVIDLQTSQFIKIQAFI